MLKIEIQTQTIMCNHPDKKALNAIFRRSFISGVGSVMSLQGKSVPLTKPYIPHRDTRRDADAIRGDWERVGRQLARAAHAVKK